MEIHSIQTPIGAALLVSIEEPVHPIDAPKCWGLIFWGRCDRASFGQLLLASSAEWIADFDINQKVAIVLHPPELAGKKLEIDTSCVEATCPKCGASDYRSNGRSWECRSCGRQWLKSGSRPRGGKREGAGRKAGLISD
jgi:predicted RNA-binding Zn-ribbon protein involved in translation (DUF1610 family)